MYQLMFGTIIPERERGFVVPPGLGFSPLVVSRQNSTPNNANRLRVPVHPAEIRPREFV